MTMTLDLNLILWMTWGEFKFSSCDRGLIPVWMSEDSHKEYVGKDYWHTSISEALDYC